ncbi:hypothetical protein CYY_002626 [Polysphondylium violaceum]|uniref:FHF complex subunit HOOK-interacting protein C-terminal domain-containing protein n=1 Tax=Polysphondylium violaceum TaxID=133409 RepID=A0A8J4Q0X8_9MYCE|nr:hypothetical protein CYY_002626 [Polysphondylium violaceum]
MVSRLFSTIGEVLAPTTHSDLDDLKSHWKAIRLFYLDKRDDIESFHEFQLPGHLISMVSLLIEENKHMGDDGPCLEFFLKNKIFETLCLLGEHDTPTGVRKLVLQTITILLSDLSLPLLPHMSAHKPICSLIKNMITQSKKTPPTSPSTQSVNNQKEATSPISTPSNTIPNTSTGIDNNNNNNSSISGSSDLIPQTSKVMLQSNDDSEFVNLLETLAIKLKKYPTLIGFFQENSFKPGETFIVYQGLLNHLWTHGSVGERARKAMIQCLELIPETPIDSSMLSPTNNVNQSNSSNEKSNINNNNNNNNSSSSSSINIIENLLTTPPPSPLKKSSTTSSSNGTYVSPLEDVPEFSDPLNLLNHIKFMNNMISELIQTYDLLPKTIPSVHYSISGPPISSENLNVLDCFKSRVSFCCSLSTLKHNGIGDYILNLWEETFLSDTLGPNLLHLNDDRSSTTMLYLKEILPLLEGPILDSTIQFLLGEIYENKEDHENDFLLRKTLIERMSSKNFIVSISALRLFSTIIGLHHFQALFNLVLVYMPKKTRFSYHNLTNLKEAQRSITNYLSLFESKSNESSSLGTLVDVFQNKVNSQTNGYSAYLVDARYQITYYSSACSNWPQVYLFPSKKDYLAQQKLEENNNSNNSSNLNNSNNNISPPVSPTLSPANSENCNSIPYIGSFLLQLISLFENSITLPIEINFVITGIFSKLCYYPCPQLYPYLIHCPNENIVNDKLSLYTVLQNLSTEIEEKSLSYPKFTEILDQLSVYMTDSNVITSKEEIRFSNDPILCELKPSDINFFNSVIILKEFCKELASIIQARVVFSSS